MYAKKSGRITFKSNKRQSFKRSNNFSDGKVRNKGNVTQQYQKYTKLAKEAFSLGDRIQTEYYYQFADHYSRLMLDLGIVLEDSVSSNDSTIVKIKNQKENNNKSIEYTEPSIAKKDETSESKDETSESKDETSESKVEDSDQESIESVSFISQPTKKKSAKIKKKST